MSRLVGRSGEGWTTAAVVPWWAIELVGVLGWVALLGPLREVGTDAVSQDDRVTVSHAMWYLVAFGVAVGCQVVGTLLAWWDWCRVAWARPSLPLGRRLQVGLLVGMTALAFLAGLSTYTAATETTEVTPAGVRMRFHTFGGPERVDFADLSAIETDRASGRRYFVFRSGTKREFSATTTAFEALAGPARAAGVRVVDQARGPDRPAAPKGELP